MFPMAGGFVFAIQDEAISKCSYLKYIIKDPKVVTDMSPLWLFVGNRPTFDSLMYKTCPY
jgi:hypothetical protein